MSTPSPSASPTGTASDLDQYEGFPHREDEGGLRDRYSWVILAVPGLLGIWDGLDLGLGTPARPGGGLWTAGLGLLLLLFAAVTAVQGHRFEAPERPGLIRMAVMLAGLATFPIMYAFAGFIVAGFVMLLIISRFSARESWRTSLILAIAAPVLVYAGFALALGVNLRLI